MAIETSLIELLIEPLLRAGAASIISGSSTGNVGTLQFGKGNSLIELEVKAGIPYNLDHYEHDRIVVGSYTFKVYMSITGKWYKRIGRGLVIYANGYVDGPCCSKCLEKSSFTEQEKFWGTKIVCSNCGKKHRQ